MLSLSSLRGSALALAAGVLVACATDGGIAPAPLVPVASVSVSPTPVTLTTGQIAPLTAVLKDANGAPLLGRAVQWVSIDPTVASVSIHGVVTARAEGTTTIRAVSEKKTGIATVHVLADVPPPAQVVAVELNVASATLEEGDVRQFTATPRDADGAPIPGLGMQWSSGDATVAAVSAIGQVTAIRPGSATITVRVHGKTASAAVTVFAAYQYDLIYSTHEDVALEIFRQDVGAPDASRARILPAGTWAGEARPSPDGTRVAFTGRIEGILGLYVMDRDGSNIERLAVPESGPVVAPTWSPDGTTIAYQTGSATSTAYDIWVMNAVDGSNKVNLTGDLGFADQTSPSWSPEFANGTSRIAFVHRANGMDRVWTMRPDGTDKRQITSGAMDLQPSWSPDGQTIVFSRTTGFVNGDVYLVNADGTDERPVMYFLSLAGPQMHPVFTPDGRMIAFASQHETWGTPDTQHQVYTIWLDGSKLARRTTNGGFWPAFISR